MRLPVENYVIRQKFGEMEALKAIRAAGFSAVVFARKAGEDLLRLAEEA